MRAIFIAVGSLLILLLVSLIKLKAKVFFGYDSNPYLIFVFYKYVHRTDFRKKKKKNKKVTKLVRNSLDHLIIEKINISVFLIPDDVYIYGALSIAYGIVNSYIKNKWNVKDSRIKFLKSNKRAIAGECILSATIGKIIYVIIKNLPEIIWAVRKEDSE